jgi:uncharacterized DUF497 family protein
LGVCQQLEGLVAGGVGLTKNYSVVTLKFMSKLQFEWDEAKASSNAKKHGVTFEEAKSVFLDDQAKLIPDPDHSDTEERFVLLGYSTQLKLLVVCHCYRATGRTSRLISARKATRHEAKAYER